MKKTLVAVALVMLMAASAQAASIGVTWLKFGAGTVAGTDGPVSQGNWNNVEGWDFKSTWDWTTYVPLKDSGVVADTGMKLDYYNWQGSGGGAQVQENHGGDSNLSNYQLSNPEAANLKITAIPYASYSIQASIRENSQGYTLAGATKYINTYVSTSTGWVEATAANSWTGNYVKWAGLSGTSQDLHALDGYDNNGAIGFVQVTDAIPEPATMSLLVLGGIAALIRRRNRRA